MVFWSISAIYCMTTDMTPFMAQIVRMSTCSFSSSNGNDTPLYNSTTVSNGDGYDSDGLILYSRKFFVIFFNVLDFKFTTFSIIVVVKDVCFLFGIG